MAQADWKNIVWGNLLNSWVFVHLYRLQRIFVSIMAGKLIGQDLKH